jgi:predicted dehydrogenase
LLPVATFPLHTTREELEKDSHVTVERTLAPVSAALLGVEHPHSLAHLRTLQQLPEVERIYLWDESDEAVARVRKELPDKVVATYTDLDALLSQRDIFFVIASVHNDIGKEVFTRSLEAGKHLMAEKPVGRNSVETVAVLETARRSGRTLGVLYQNRANAVIQEARRIVAAGALGPLMSVEMRIITTAVRFRKPETWMFNKEKAGGGMLTWLGCHYIDLLRYITGDEIVSVQAEVATRSGEKIDVEDIAVLSMRLKSGAVASLHTGYILSLSGGGYFNPSGYDNYVGINGRLGRVHWSSSGGPTEYKAESVHPNWASAPQWSGQYVPGAGPGYGGKTGEAFLREFIHAAHEGRTSWATGEDALMVARVVDGAYESSRTGKRVEIDPVHAR